LFEQQPDVQCLERVPVPRTTFFGIALLRSNIVVSFVLPAWPFFAESPFLLLFYPVLRTVVL